MSVYKAFYKNKSIDIFNAASSLDARNIAAKAFKAKKPYEVTVFLVHYNGREVIHIPDF